ncbi:hypothetical protein NA57DRAFT_63700 [Rhizodiscina lignyota]|uniref:GST N-terminal domain-containing protein n=1 Tax=Rhizodiscina lignyota TaxID=1504668 RepID=A0A9P4MD02_9PEZI|nr:hypothetical protein NA57DRAFT_63700 [Rhizodiscina lignyota]
MEAASYTLHHHRYSICSIMVRYCIAIRGEPKSGMSEATFFEKEIDIFANEQLSEDFLCHVNPKGQVPAITTSSLDQPLYDSVTITHYLASLYPSLMPPSHRQLISSLIDLLHSINFFSLSFAGSKNGDPAGHIKQEIQRRLRKDVSPRYREALEYKLAVHEAEKVYGLGSDFVTKMISRTESLLFICQQNLPEGARWMLGLPQPSALDAHLVTFIARLEDAGRTNLVPPRLSTYCADARETEEWRRIMQGRKTAPGR